MSKIKKKCLSNCVRSGL